MRTQRHVIVGAGLAGARTAEALRAAGSQERIVLVGDEEDAPYHRPPLSKEFLAGDKSRGELDVLPATWYRDNGVELVTGARAVDIDTYGRSVALEDGRELGYDGLVLTTGASPRRLEVPGVDADGVMMLRRAGDSEALREAIGDATSLVVVGGGWIGLEVASLAVRRGVEVTVVERSALPLGAVIGPEMAGVFLGLHRDHGVRFRLVHDVTEILTEGGRAAGVRLDDGRMIPADLVLVAVGATPNVATAERALEVDDGIVVDRHLRTAVPDVYAAGDVASAFNPFLGRRIRVEHWANAKRQPAVVAANLLGGSMRYDRLPYFFTDQYDLGMEYTGDAAPGSYDEVVVRGDVSALEFVAFWLKDSRVVAAMSANVADVIPSAELIIRTLAVVDTDELADPSVELSHLATRAVRPSTVVDVTEGLESVAATDAGIGGISSPGSRGPRSG